MSNFKVKGTDILGCGVYLWNGTLNGTQGSILVSVPTSISSFINIAADNTIDCVIVYPGFMVEIYNDAGYVTKNCKVDNTFSNKVIIRRLLTSNIASSIKVFYNGTEITNLTGLS